MLKEFFSIFTGKKPTKNFASAMAGFSKVITDLNEVVEREQAEIEELEAKKSEIEAIIDEKDTEMKDCQMAIHSIGGMFPNLTRK